MPTEYSEPSKKKRKVDEKTDESIKADSEDMTANENGDKQKPSGGTADVNSSTTKDANKEKEDKDIDGSKSDTEINDKASENDKSNKGNNETTPKQEEVGNKETAAAPAAGVVEEERDSSKESSSTKKNKDEDDDSKKEEEKGNVKKNSPSSLKETDAISTLSDNKNPIASTSGTTSSNPNTIIPPGAVTNYPGGLQSSSTSFNTAASSMMRSMMNPPNKAMSFPSKVTNESDAVMTGMSQSERKRYREKKRRSEITNAIDQLTKMLLKVEPSNLIQQNNLVYSTNCSPDMPTRSSGRLGHAGASQQPLNRTEIINHAVAVLERLYLENEDRKIQIMRLHSMVNDIASHNGGGANAQMMMMSQPAMMYQQQAPPQSKLTSGAPGATNNAFANAGSATSMQSMQGMPIQMQPHPSFMPPAALQQMATAAAAGNSAGDSNSIQNGMMMTSTNHGGANPSGARTSFEQQFYFTQQFLGQQQQQQMMREQQQGGHQQVGK